MIFFFLPTLNSDPSFPMFNLIIGVVFGAFLLSLSLVKLGLVKVDFDSHAATGKLAQRDVLIGFGMFLASILFFIFGAVGIAIIAAIGFILLITLLIPALGSAIKPR